MQSTYDRISEEIKPSELKNAVQTHNDMVNAANGKFKQWEKFCRFVFIVNPYSYKFYNGVEFTKAIATMMDNDIYFL